MWKAMANYHIKPIVWKTGTQTPGSPNLENGDGVLYFTFFNGIYAEMGRKLETFVLYYTYNCVHKIFHLEVILYYFNGVIQRCCVIADCSTFSWGVFAWNCNITYRYDLIKGILYLDRAPENYRLILSM